MAVYFLGNGGGPPELLLKNPNSLCCGTCYSHTGGGRLQCECGESEDEHAWLWTRNGAGNATVVNGGREVLFHPVYSAGTAAVRGDGPLQRNRHHYFEVKILTYLYGTDIMVGVGTGNVNLTACRSRFCSMLGDDDQSWGFSYHGAIQHKRMSRKYGEEFGMGSLVGVHVDMYEGTLEYYLNRIPLGVAFKGLKDHELYPMVCSTAAQSSVRLSCSVTFEASLQFYTLKAVNRNPDHFSIYDNIPGLRRMVRKELFWLVPRQSQAEVPEIDDFKHLELEDEAVIPLGTIAKSPRYLNVEFRLNKWGRYVSSAREDLSTCKRRRGCMCLRSFKKKRQFVPEMDRYVRRLETYRRNLRGEPAEAKADGCEECADVDLYGDLPTGQDSECRRYCAECNFRLGSHDECKKDFVCSLCDGTV